MMIRILVLLISSLSLSSWTSEAFVRPTPSSSSSSLVQTPRHLPTTSSKPFTVVKPKSSSTHPWTSPSSSSSSSLHMSLPILSMVRSAVSSSPLQTLSRPIVKRMLFVLGATMLFLSKQYKRILWPGSGADPTLKDTTPLPPGSMGCPFFGHNFMLGTNDYGPMEYFHRAAQRYGNPNLMKLYAYGNPMVAVTGSKYIRQVLKDEFTTDGVNTELIGPNYDAIFGGSSILYEPDRTKHGVLRRLVGASMTPVAISHAVPAIQTAANIQIDKMLLFVSSSSSSSTSQPVIKMEDYANDYTMEVAWRQILGLDLKPDEVSEFYEQTKAWVEGLFNPLFAFPFKVPGLQFTKSYKARQYLVNKVEEKLNYLDVHGPDDSTLSGIYFATDDEDDETGTTPRKLTRQQVIDNALILIIAGSETSASTLTVATLLLGLHPDVWYQVKKEQQAMIDKYGNAITSKAQIDTECPYLDAVIRETLRMRPVPSMELRRTKKTLVVDGMQIPKDYMVVVNVRGTHEQDPVTAEPNEAHMDVHTGFHPDRWLSDEDTKPTSEWMPFGVGARRCLGENLAMLEMKVFLATLARRVDFDLVTTTDNKNKIQWRKISAMPRPLDGVEITVRPAAATSLVVE